jgi:hypothetical protein
VAVSGLIVAVAATNEEGGHRGRSDGMRDSRKEKEMSTETMQDRQRSAEERRAALGRRIDGVREKARNDRDKMNRGLERRLDAVRAKDAEIRTELRRMAEEDEAAWKASFEELDRELDELDAETAVAEGQIAAALAEDWDAYERATDAELDAYDRMLEESREGVDRAKTDVQRRSREAVARARDKVEAVGEALRRGGVDAARHWRAKRDEIRADLDEVDALVVDAVADLETDMIIDMNGERSSRDH